jgi:hypothetical protein
MPSSPELNPSGANPARRLADTVRHWNRRLHFYLGLYFLFFVWLFALTGLLLNHGSWKFAEFWPNRKVSTDERPIQPPTAGNTLEGAKHLMDQLGIAGEIQWLNTRPDPARFEFRVSRPGTNFEIQADLQTARAKIQRTELNGWGILHTLHTFTGVRVGDTRNQRDWVLTTVWALAMDAVAAGLVVMVLSGIVLWLVQPGKRLGGLLALGCGVLVCAWFVAGLRLFFA